MNRAQNIYKAYELHKHAAYGRHLELCKLLERAADGESLDQLAAELIPLEFSAETAAVPLIDSVSALTEQELVELVACTTEQYSAWRQLDPEISDLVQFKHEIYRYILNPSPLVVAAYARHVAETAQFGA